MFYIIPNEMSFAESASSSLESMRRRVAQVPRFVNCRRGSSSEGYLLLGSDGSGSGRTTLGRLRSVNEAYADLLTSYHDLARAFLIEENGRWTGTVRKNVQEAWHDVSLRSAERVLIENAVPPVVEFVIHAFDDARVLLDLIPSLITQFRARKGR